MPIYPLLHGQAFEPELIDAMALALEEILRALRLTDRKDPLIDLVAKRIIRIAQTGERDPQRMREHVLRSLNHAWRDSRNGPEPLSGDGRPVAETCEAVL
ncbi:MAG: hypothetical protein ACLPKB_26820 [Xanthobacteraceae bacterium]